MFSGGHSLDRKTDPISFGKKKDTSMGYPIIDSNVKSKSHSSKMSTCERVKRDSIFGKWSVATWLWIILVPVIIYILLLTFAPTFVITSQNGDTTVDHSRILLWTLVLSIIIWVLLWGLNYCKSC